MFPQILVTFSEFKKMEQTCCVLLEKLDKSVQVGTPRFFHSAACLSELRCLQLQTGIVSFKSNAGVVTGVLVLGGVSLLLFFFKASCVCVSS